MSLMNSFWTVLDWFLPAIRLSDDLRLDDLEALAGRPYAIQTRTLSTPSRSQHQPRRPQPPDAERSSGRHREQRKDAEREREGEDVSRLRWENDELREKVRALEASLSEANAILVPLSHNVRPPTPSPSDSALQTAYDNLRAAYASAQRTLSERSEEVSSLRTFLTKTDDLSGAQLVQATNDLNLEIIQLSASIVEHFSSYFTRKSNSARQSDRAMLHPALGVRTTQLLEELQHGADPTFVQYAIQAWEVAFVGKMVSAFCFGAPSDLQEILSSVFQSIQAAEPQATSSRWRALTHSHLKAYLFAPRSSSNGYPPPTPVSPEAPISPTSPAPPTKSSSSKLLESQIISNIRGIIAIMALAGNDNRNAVHSGPMYEAYGSKLARILDRALQLATAFRERVMSSAFEVVVVPPTAALLNSSTPRHGSLSVNIPGEVAFDHHIMTSVFGQSAYEEDEGNVLCTIELGLACVRKTEAEDGPSVSSHGEGRSRSEERHAPDEVKAPNSMQRTKSSTSDPNAPVVALDRNLLIKPKVMVDSSTLAYLQA